MQVDSFKRRSRLSTIQLIWACVLLAAFASALCLLRYRHQPETRFRQFCHALYKSEMTANTITLHYSLAHPENFGITNYPVSLPLYKVESEKRAQTELHSLIQEFSALSREGLSSEDLYAYKCLERTLILSNELARYPYYDNPFSSVNGMQSELPILLSEYVFRNKKDIDEYLTLLSQVGDYFSSLLVYESEKISAGLSPSREALKQSSDQCDAIVTSSELSQGKHFLQTSFRERLSALAETEQISSQEMAEFISRNNTILSGIVCPAYQELKVALAELADLAPTGLRPLSSLPDGPEYYRLLLASITGSGKKPAQVKKKLEQTLVSEANAIKQLIEKYPACLPALQTHSYEDLGINDENVMISDLQSHMVGIYPELMEPCHHIVKYVSPNLQTVSAPAFYLTAPIDDASQNVIYVNPSSSKSNLELYVTLAHEGYPGHLYQNAYCASHLLSLKDNKPRQLLGCGGYLEGWAFYVEQNAYDDAAKLLISQDRVVDAVCVLIAKHERSLRTCLCALTDVMLHYEGASPDDISKHCSTLGIQNIDGENFDPLCEYISESPCNYLKYYLGYLEILELKDFAQTLWGGSFNKLKFHEFLLMWGPADFEHLRERLEETRNDK